MTDNLPPLPEFEKWLRSVCFQAPPAHAYDLARCAWIEADKQASADVEAMAEEIQRLQNALAFWMPGVPSEEHPLHERVARDAYLLVGYDGPNNEPSAFELGHVTLAALAQAQSCVPAEPPFGSKRNAALALYRPPFKFLHGYIYDADGKMCADEGAMPEHVAARVRGWGRIGYMPDAEALQDEVGQMIAEALTSFWLAASPQPQPVQPSECGSPRACEYEGCRGACKTLQAKPEQAAQPLKHADEQLGALKCALLAPKFGQTVISSAAYIELYEAAAPQPKD